MKLLNSCVVCYKHVPSSTVNKNVDCVTARFIRLFQRHINNFSFDSTHDQIKVTRSAITLAPINRSDKPITFQTCEKCSEMLSIFNCSYGDLKCAEMKANWSLQQLANVIRFADYAPARRTKFRESFNDFHGDNQLIDDMIENISTFRKQLQSQCRLQYKNQFPRVVVVKPITAKIATENFTECKKQQKGNSLMKSKEALLSTVLKNLSSLQLILYLALCDSSIPDTKNTSNNNFDALEQHGNSVGSSTKRVKMSIERNTSVEGLLSTPSPISGGNSPNNEIVDCDDGMNDEWDPGDSVECSTVDAEKTDGETRFYTEDSLQTQELQCRISAKPPQRQIVVHLKDYTDSNINRDSGEDIAGDDADALIGSCDGPTKTYTEYRIQIIQNVTIQSCSICQVDFDSEKELEQHLATCSKTCSDATNTGSSNVPVKQASTVFSSQKRMRRDTSHLNRNIYKYRCKQCGQRFKGESGLTYHNKTHLGEAAMKHSCSICGKKFITKQNMKRHMRTHTGEKPFKCSEENCEKSFTVLQSLQSHTIKYHTKSRCDNWRREQLDTECSRNVEIKQEPIEITNEGEMKLNTDIINRYRCDQCGKRCNSHSSLWYHKSIHLGSAAKKFFCSICGKKFTTKQNLKRHMRVHTGEKPYKCPEADCKATFTYHETFRYHLHRCHGTEVAKHCCSHCGKRFIRRDFMLAHSRTHTKDVG